MAASGQKHPKILGGKDRVLKYEALLIGRRRGNVKRLPRSTWAIDAALVCVFAKVAIALGLGWVLLPGHLSATAPKNFDPLPLKQVADIRMPGPAVRFDYQSLDISSGRLYIAHMKRQSTGGLRHQEA